MSDQGVTFIHKNGRVIPIRTPSGAGQAAQSVLQAPNHAVAAAVAPINNHLKERAPQIKKAAHAVHNAANSVKVHVDEGLAKVGLYHPEIAVNHKLDMLGLGLSVASGVIGAATFSHGSKKFIGGLIASHAVDAAGTAANVASVAGHGFRKERVKQGAKQEARNFIIGNGVFLAGLVGVKRNRKQLGSVVQHIVSFGKRALG